MSGSCIQDKARQHRNDRTHDLTSVSIAHDIGFEAGYTSRNAEIAAAKAEALREAAEELGEIDQAGDAVYWTDEGYEFVHEWLAARADEMEARS